MKKYISEYVTTDVRRALLEAVGVENYNLSNQQLERKFLLGELGEEFTGMGTNDLWRKWLLGKIGITQSDAGTLTLMRKVMLDDLGQEFNGMGTQSLIIKWAKEGGISNPKEIKLEVTAGLFDFSVTNANNLLWVFADGSTSTDIKPTRTLTEDQTVKVYCDDWSKSNIVFRDNDTNTNYVGDIKVLKRLRYYANFYNCANLTGDISALSNISYYADFYNCANLTGDISALSNISYYASFGNCANLVGVLNPHPSLRYLYLNNTGLSINDVDQTVINLDTNTTATSTRALNISGLERSTVSSSAIASLITKGWSVTDATVV